MAVLSIYDVEETLHFIDVKNVFYVFLFSNKKRVFLTFFLFSQRFLLIKKVGQQFQL